MNRSVAALLTCTSLALGASAAAAPAQATDGAATASARCPQFGLAGRTYNLDVLHMPCAKGTRLAKRHIAYGQKPAGFSCFRTADGHQGGCKKRSSKVTVTRFRWDLAASAE